LSTVYELFLKGKSRLKTLPQAQPSLEAKLLLLKCASLCEEEFVSEPEKEISKKVEHAYFELIAKRRARIPLAYLTGYKEFWSKHFHIFPGVFIPRPETELLVEKVVELSSRKNEILVDIGTGCGNIAISLASELPWARVYGTDISRKALRVAELNAKFHGIASITFLYGDLFFSLKKLALHEKCDFIVSNPPYVSEKEWMRLGPEIKEFEPKQALVPGRTGLEFVGRLIRESLPFLKPAAYLLFEIGRGQARKVVSQFDSRWKDIKIFNDLRGIPRVIVACKAK